MKPFLWAENMKTIETAKFTDAVRMARKIPLGRKTPEKSKAVHTWALAVKAMLKG